ncbi:MAG: hypothetical protein ACI9G1_001566 [Pirellulaceae bacterium]|jgi:hypothetical protein
MQRSDIRSLVVTFSEPVDITSSDLRLTNLGVDAPATADVEFALTAQHLSLNGNVLTISFAANELAEGVYQLEVLPSTTDSFGNNLDGDANGVSGDAHTFRGNDTNSFYKLTAEWNGDGVVSVFDFTTFSYWFGASTVAAPFAPEYADLSGDGGVSVFDFTGFSNNFGIGVVYPQAFAAIVAPELTPRLDEELLIEQTVASDEHAGHIADPIRQTRLTPTTIAPTAIAAIARTSIDDRIWNFKEADFEDLIDVLADDVGQMWN